MSAKSHLLILVTLFLTNFSQMANAELQPIQHREDPLAITQTLDPLNWAKSISSEEYLTYLKTRQRIKEHATLPNIHTLNQTMQKLIDFIDARFRELQPQSVHIPKPTALVLNTIELNAWVSRPVICYQGSFPYFIGTNYDQYKNSSPTDFLEFDYFTPHGMNKKKVNFVSDFPCLQKEISLDQQLALHRYSLKGTGCEPTFDRANKHFVLPNSCVSWDTDHEMIESNANNFSLAKMIAPSQTVPFIHFTSFLIYLMEFEELFSITAHELAHYYLAHDYSRHNELYAKSTNGERQNGQESEQLNQLNRELIANKAELKNRESHQYSQDAHMGQTIDRLWLLHIADWVDASTDVGATNRIADLCRDNALKCQSCLKIYEMNEIGLKESGSNLRNTIEYNYQRLPRLETLSKKCLENYKAHDSQRIPALSLLVKRVADSAADYYVNLNPHAFANLWDWYKSTYEKVIEESRKNSEKIETLKRRNGEINTAIHLAKKSGRLGWYTVEQEADEVALKFLKASSVNLKGSIDSMRRLEAFSQFKKLLAKNSSLDGPNNIKNMSQEHFLNWVKPEIERMLPISNQTLRECISDGIHRRARSVNDLKQPHHSNCYRIYNILLHSSDPIGALIGENKPSSLPPVLQSVKNQWASHQENALKELVNQGK